MFKIRYFLCFVVACCRLLAQQKIDSTGNNNTNINAHTVVNVTVNQTTKKILRREAKASLGDGEGWQGILVPGSDKISPIDCHAPADFHPPKPVLTVRAGGNQFSCTQLPCNIIRTYHRELLWVDGKKGVLTVGSMVLAADGTVLAGIEKNKFYVNRNRTWRPPIRDDASSLRVVDEKNNTILKLRFANEDTLLVEGSFNDGAGNEMKVLTDSIRTVSPLDERSEISGSCLYFDFRIPGLETAPFVFGGPIM